MSVPTSAFILAYVTENYLLRQKMRIESLIHQPFQPQPLDLSVFKYHLIKSILQATIDNKDYMFEDCDNSRPRSST